MKKTFSLTIFKPFLVIWCSIYSLFDRVSA